MEKQKELLFSITSKDCTFTPYRGSGAGGQKRNKTSSAMRCVHNSSGAVGECESHREQSLNKREAFLRMSKTEVFTKWLDIEIKRKSGQLALLEAKFEKSMENIRIDIKSEDGKWIETTEL